MSVGRYWHECRAVDFGHGRFGKFDSVCRRFRRLAQTGVRQAAFEALKEPDLERVMLDSAILRAHRHAAGQKSTPETERLGRSRGGMSTRLHACTYALGNAVVIPNRPQPLRSGPL